MFEEIDYSENGLLGSVEGGVREQKVIDVFLRARYFTTGQTIVFLNPITGLKTAGPVNVQTYDSFGERLVVSNKVTVERGDAIYLEGSQDECNPPKVGFDLSEQEKDV